ncbi:hypothetical protein [Dyella sp. C11]|uniref:hypothetical protein n=1 Tax=Dyella sp. C11 TaxID=2126991 RepID=UPI000D65BF69|nr:hypothetical protein [Dyella sp. C11]
MRLPAVMIGLSLCACLSGCETVTPQQQHASDEQTCASYGYQPGTDKFADCMMSTAHRRDDAKAAQQNQREHDRQLSIQRNGDSRYPICSAADMNASLDTVNNKWFGAGCREE